MMTLLVSSGLKALATRITDEVRADIVAPGRQMATAGLPRCTPATSYSLTWQN